jgi:hypothetical protein
MKGILHHVGKNAQRRPAECVKNGLTAEAIAVVEGG